MPSFGFYTDENRLRQIEKGNARFVCALLEKFTEKKFSVHLHELQEMHRYKIKSREDFMLFEKMLVADPHIVTLRSAGLSGYWTFENSEFRRDFRLAQAEYDPDLIDENLAQKFFQRVQRNRKIDADQSHQKRRIYIALQGRILLRRADQFMSPLEMIEAVGAAGLGDEIIIGLHPREDYSAVEKKALAQIAQQISAQIVTGRAYEMLARCTLMVTMNSTVTIPAYLFKRPVVLCGFSEFHHIARICRSADEMSAAIRAAFSAKIDYERYIYWYLSLQNIHAVAPNAVLRACERLRGFGWPL